MLDHQRDLWADFRAFFHLSPAESLALPGPEYLALAWRTPAYAGAMAARVGWEAPDATSAPGAPSRGVDVPIGGMPSVGADGDLIADLFDYAVI